MDQQLWKGRPVVAKLILPNTHRQRIFPLHPLIFSSSVPQLRTSSSIQSSMPDTPPRPTAVMPAMMYGTAWKKDRTADLVYEAIKAGFRGIDTAAMKRHYDEALVGEGIRRAIREGIVTRGDLFASPPSFDVSSSLPLTTTNTFSSLGPRPPFRSKPSTPL
jgi:hypothetical protein